VMSENKLWIVMCTFNCHQKEATESKEA
jgi:hypothetical protein